MKKIAVLASLVLLGAGSAQAAEYNQVLNDKSTFTFIYKQMNVPVEGSFKRFNGQLNFDPAKPATAKAQFQIELASIDTGSAEGNEEVGGKLWFNTKAFPTAQFVSTSIKPLGNNRFEVSGKMTIKGKTQDVSTQASFRPDGANASFDGAFVLKRADFTIGEGMWADFGTVANEVQVKFHLLATTKK